MGQARDWEVEEVAAEEVVEVIEIRVAKVWGGLALCTTVQGLGWTHR